MTAPKQDFAFETRMFTFLVCQPQFCYIVIINEIDLHFNCFQSVSAWIGIPTESSPHGFPALVTRSPQESPLVSVVFLEHTQPVQHCVCFKVHIQINYLHLCRVFLEHYNAGPRVFFLSHFTFNEHFCFKSFTFVVCALS